MEAFGVLSGMAAILLALRHRRFTRLRPAVQAAIAIGTWTVHVTVFFLVLFGMSF